MDSGSLDKQAAHPHDFNWVFLIELLGFGAVALVYVFYFNRIFAWTISLAIRSFSKRYLHVFISIEAIQISILGGRVFFKGFRYHGQNETILIVDGFITWRYWLRRVQKSELSTCSAETKTKVQSGGSTTSRAQQRNDPKVPSGDNVRVTRHDLPCRILLEARGLEWFVYNRSPAYDAILAELSKPDSASNVDPSSSNQRNEKVDVSHNSDPKQVDQPRQSSDIEKSPGKLSKHTNSRETVSLARDPDHKSTKDGGDQDELPCWLSLLPVGISCEKGAIILGNENTKHLLVTKFDRVKGQVGASGTRELDLYRQTFDFDADHLVIQLRPNKDHVESQLAHGVRGTSPVNVRAASRSGKGHRARPKSTWQGFRQRWLYKVPYFSHSSDSVLLDPVHSIKRHKANDSSWHRQENQVWHGLSRYLDDEDEVLVEQERWKAIEYAAVQNLVDFPTASMSLHWDVPGPVTEFDAEREKPDAKQEGDINGATPPDWEITFRVGGGTINYGPWADRNRVDIQNLFFPPSFIDASPAAYLKKGETRVSTRLKVRIEFEVQAILRIPTREESKDWRWKGKAGHGPLQASQKVARKQSIRAKKVLASASASETRPPGWLEVAITPDSCITYETDLVASDKGYRSKLNLEFKRPQMSTSVNHDLIWRSHVLAVSCDLSTPLKWSGPRHWHFDVLGDSMEIFLLRDHVFLLTDMINDSTSGPQATYQTFVPFTYNVTLRLLNFKINLYANDSNIIDDPSNTDEKNSVLALSGPLGVIDVTLPFIDYRPLRNKVHFGIDASDVRVQIDTPSWNTFKAFLTTPDVGSIKHAYIHGSYDFYSATSPSVTDTLILHIDVEELFVKTHGFFIRRLMILKDNYFGEDYHFQTLDEYQAKLNRISESEGAGVEETHNARPTNDLDVVLALKLDDTTIALPSNIYSDQNVIKVEISSLELDLRFTNYYMDIEVILSPLALGCGVTKPGAEGFEDMASTTQMFIDGIRIFGHRLFGLPPAEPTYVCNWDLNVGSISGECSATFLRELLSAFGCIAFSYQDLENALPLVKPTVIHDLTFLRVKVDAVKVWVSIEATAMLVQTNALTLQYNDWANPRFSDYLQAHIAGILIASIDTQSSSRRRNGLENMTAHAFLETSLNVHLASTKPDSETDRELQQKHIELHDMRTQRIGWLIQKPFGEDKMQEPPSALKIRAPGMPFPPMPRPVYKSDDQRLHPPLTMSQAPIDGSSRKRTSLRSKNSFLSDAARSFSKHPSMSQERSPNPVIRPLSSKREPSKLSTGSLLQFERPALSATMSGTSILNGAGGPSFPSQRGQIASAVLFTSPYQQPHFPLYGIVPDARDVPTINAREFAFNEDLEANGPDEDALNSRDPASQHTYVHATLESGVRLLLTPEGLRGFQALALSQQPGDAASILDDLQMQAINSTAIKGKHTSSSFTKIRIQVPILAATFIDKIQGDQDANQRRHRYDLYLGRLVSTIGVTDRESTGRTLDVDIGYKYLVHAAWEKLNLSAKVESQHDARGLANIAIVLDKGNLSLAVDPGITGDLSLENFEVACINRRVAYLSSLLQTTTVHVEGLLCEFRKLTMGRTHHIEQFVFALLDCKDPPRDPIFFTSASYVLRSAVDHVRHSDSWKMVVRLRQIQLSRLLLSDNVRDDRNRVDGPNNLRPRKDIMCQKFFEWRGWDLSDPKSSAFIDTIYGPVTLATSRTAAPITDSIRISVESRTIAILVNPGPEQNEFSIANLTICFISTNSKSSSSETQVELFDSPRDHTLEVLVESTKARINWDIFQLVDDMNRQFMIPDEISPTQSSQVALPPSSPSYHRCHVTLLSSTSTLELASINLQYSSTAENFKSSLIIDYLTKRDVLICSDLHVKRVTTNLSGSSKLLLSCHLLEPSVHLMFEQVPTSVAKEGIVTVAAFCQSLSLRTEQDIHGILAVFDSIISDEVQHVETILQGFRKDNSLPHSPSKNRDAKDLWMVQTAFSLGSYQVSVLLLPSLEYAVRGGLARSTLRPKRHRPAGLLFDFDLEEHNQSLVSINNGDRQGVFTLLLPPVNGVFGWENKKSSPKITANVVIETIVLDAASLYHAISASLQSDLMTLREGVWRDFEMVKSRFLSVVSPSESAAFPVTNFTPDRSLILFQAHVAIAGLDILASTVKNDAESSHLHFHLACITVTASNQDPETRRSLEFVEGSLNLTDVKLRMEHTVGATSFPGGDLAFTASFRVGSKLNGDNELVRNFESAVKNLQVDLYTGTASLLIDILAHLRQRLQKLDLSEEIRGVRARQRLRGRLKTLSNIGQTEEPSDEDDSLAIGLFTTMFLFEVNEVQVSWNVGDHIPIKAAHEREDLVLSISKIELATKRENAARLMIQDFQVQLVPVSQSKALRSANSALLPKVIFNVAYFSTPKERRLAFQSTGQSLDLRLTSNFILPASDVQRSVAIASQELREVISSWNTPQFQSGGQMTNIIGSKRLSSFLVDADFAGAVVYIQSQALVDSLNQSVNGLRNGRSPQPGRYGQFVSESAGSSMMMRSPGVAWKIEYGNSGVEDPTLSAEIKIDASENTLHPAVVPLLVEMSSSVREVVGKSDDRQPSPKAEAKAKAKASPPKSLAEDKLGNTDPTAILGSCKLNIGLTICKQEFSLTCQPVARVAATAKFERINLAINTVQAEDTRFFTIFIACSQLNASVQHIYSRESTGTFEVDSIVLSMMNSKHVSSADGISAIARSTPVKVSINAKQVHDFLLFREIWMPVETHAPNPNTDVTGQTEPQTIIVQRYQQMAATGAFPWNASVSVAAIDIGIDFGPILGKSNLFVSELWVCSKKSSDWEQSLCLGLDSVSASSIGRMSGSVGLTDLRVRTSIRWPIQGDVASQTPVVEASSHFSEISIKAAFDYQAFLIANVSDFDFLMFNVKGNREVENGDRLVGVLNIDKLQAFSTTSSAAQGLALYQAVERLIQEKRTAYMNSLREIEKHLRRKSSTNPLLARVAARQKEQQQESKASTPIRLHTDVAVSIQAIHAGVFPGTFFDTQLFKLETVDTSARFSVSLAQGKVHSSLGLQLGLLRIALSSVTKPALPKSLEEVSVAEIVQLAISSRGGTILKVPRVIADMQTWQAPTSNEIDYIFRSAFEGKVEVGWNYSRISFIRGMWANHTRTLAHRLGKPLPQSAVQITGGPQPPGEEASGKSAQEQEKITAVVNVPLSKYQYTALETPIIETPQLRDMGEATPPLEWIGLHRERLPNLTHQIVIVTLLEVAKEVEDAYTQILGS